MTLPGLTSILTTVAFCLAAAGCAGVSTDQDFHADHIKDMVMNRYDGFAEAGGECGEK